MRRYIRTVMLLLAGLCFMIPFLARTSAARPISPRMHGANHMHQTFDPEADDVNADDPTAPCAP